METTYTHLCLRERIELYRLHQAGHSIRAIAKHLNRTPQYDKPQASAQQDTY